MTRIRPPHGNAHITSNKWKLKKASVYESVCVWVCMPLHAPSVSVFVCCLATSDACANEGKFSCFIWSWKILVGYVVVDSEPEAGGLPAIGCRVVCWCQQALQQHLTTPPAFAACEPWANSTVVVFTLYPHSIWNPRPCKQTAHVKALLCACENQRQALWFCFLWVPRHGYGSANICQRCVM